MSDAPLGSARKWAITFSVMMVTVMQVLDTSITNVALPHMQGSFTASIDEMSWVITSYLAANAVVIPASGWLTSVFGRRRFYLICTVTFTASSFLSGIAPNLEFLILMRILQGLGGGPVVPMSQAVMWEIFPLEQRGTAMAVWGTGIMLAPILGPTVGGYIADNWSWRWIFYINLPIGILAIFMVGLGFNSSLLLLALYTQTILGYDAWTAGLTLAPGGLGTMIALMISGRLVSRMDQRLMLAGGCSLAAVALFFMTQLTSTIDFWNLAWPRFLQGFSQGFIFVPLQALTLATIPTERLGNPTAAYKVARHIRGSLGGGLVTTLLARRSQVHQATLTGHLDPWSFEMAERLRVWTNHFVARGADTYTAGRPAMAMLYRETVTQANILSYADDFWLLLAVYCSVLLLIPFMRRVRSGGGAQGRRSTADESVARDPGLPSPPE